tara:strand:+ start:71828 stop:72472 length:645 start_codon:yes stop_codon:yes gene_type:complete
MKLPTFTKKTTIWTIILGLLMFYAWFEGSLFGDINKIGDRLELTSSAAGANIGGPFSLIDHNGKTVTEKNFSNRHKLVFFGYSWCPDICPTELLVISKVLEILDVEKSKLATLFITIDPARDTPEQLASYLSIFHPDIIGLTGTQRQIEAAAKEYRVYYRRVNNPEAEDSSIDDDYIMDHSVYIYLISPEDEYVRHFSRGQEPVEIAEEVRKHL